ncbi:MAG: ribbon-helix-helix protein, CopG family [Phycisphaerales bacterium]|nr:ribbon-helix-helix protein, CopG family [Phycisphaerales bacterium]
MPRPRLNRKRLESTLPAELLARLDTFATQAGRTRSDIIETALREYFDKQSKPPKQGDK